MVSPKGEVSSGHHPPIGVGFTSGKAVAGEDGRIRESACTRFLTRSSKGTGEGITDTGQPQEEVSLERKAVSLGNVKYRNLERTGKNRLSQQ